MIRSFVYLLEPIFYRMILDDVKPKELSLFSIYMRPCAPHPGSVERKEFRKQERKLHYSRGVLNEEEIYQNIKTTNTQVVLIFVLLPEQQLSTDVFDFHDVSDLDCVCYLGSSKGSYSSLNASLEGLE